jgi:hypothetical protein
MMVEFIISHLLSISTAKGLNNIGHNFALVYPMELL